MLFTESFQTLEWYLGERLRRTINNSLFTLLFLQSKTVLLWTNPDVINCRLPRLLERCDVLLLRFNTANAYSGQRGYNLLTCYHGKFPSNWEPAEDKRVDIVDIKTSYGK